MPDGHRLPVDSEGTEQRNRTGERDVGGLVRIVPGLCRRWIGTTRAYAVTVSGLVRSVPSVGRYEACRRRTGTADA